MFDWEVASWKLLLEFTFLLFYVRIYCKVHTFAYPVDWLVVSEVGRGKVKCVLFAGLVLRAERSWKLVEGTWASR